MAWPTNKPNSNQFNSDSDSIKQSRPELKTMSDAVNDIVDFIDTTNIQNNYILKYNSTSGALEFVAESGGSTELLTDTTPQLGGTLDLNNNSIGNFATDSGSADNVMRLDNSILSLNFEGTSTKTIYNTGQLNIESGGSTVHINTSGTGSNVNLGNTGTVGVSSRISLSGNNSWSPKITGSASDAGPTTVPFRIAGYGEYNYIDFELPDNISFEPDRSEVTIKAHGKDTGSFHYSSQINLKASYIEVGDSTWYSTDSAGEGDVQAISAVDGYGLQLSSGGPRLRSYIRIMNEDSAGGGQIEIVPMGGANPDSAGFRGHIFLHYTKWPETDGSSGQVLQTNGAGELSWASVAGGGGTSGIQHLTAGTGIQLTSEDSAGEVTISNDGMINLSDDAAPQLGGNLDVVNFKIVSTSAQDIKIEPEAAGDIYLESDTVFAGELNQQAHLTSQGTGNLLLTTNNDISSGRIKINQGASANIEIQPDGGGKIRFHNAYNMPSSDGSNGQVITTDGFGNLSFTTIAGGGGGGIQDIVAGTGINVTQDDSAGSVTISSTVVGGDTVSAGDNIEITAPDSTGAKGINFRNPFNTQIDAGDQIIKRPILQDYAETVNTIGSGGATVTPDQVNGNVQKLTLTTTPVTMNLPVNMPTGGSMTLILRQDGAGNRVVNFNASYKFAGGSKTLSTAPNAIDIVSVFNDGTDYLASLSTNFS